MAKVDPKQFSAGTYTLNDILEELRKPGRDPRDKFVAPSFSEKVREFSDVQPEMVLEGVVTNVTKFGAFVDIGVHQDGLVHLSELSNRYIKDPAEAVKTGQIVKVKVLSADTKTRRIALSIKALQGPSQRPQRAPQQKLDLRSMKSSTFLLRSGKSLRLEQRFVPASFLVALGRERQSQLRSTSSLSIRTICKLHRSSMCLRNLLGEHEADAGSTRLRCVERYKEVSGVRQSRARCRVWR